MADLIVKKLLGGLGNGLDAPTDWEGPWVWTDRETGDTSTYTTRVFFHNSDRFTIWVDKGVPEGVFREILFWHREMYRGDLVDAQKSLLHESMTAAQNYTNVIMVVGYAALFTFWTQFRSEFAAGTSFAIVIFLALSTLSFVGWELFGMITRSRINIQIAKAVDEPDQYERHLRTYHDFRATLMRKFQKLWVATMAAAMGFAILAFGIMMCAMLHGAWIEFLRASVDRLNL